MTQAKIITELVAAAAYVRMSSDDQKDSPERQRMQIEHYAKAHGFHIVTWYQDSGMTGTESSRRKSYQQLLADAPSGMFSAVLITEQSRMSREDLFAVFPSWGILRDAGVKIVSCQSGEIDFGSLGGMITAMVNQYSSHDEVKKMADRIVTGQIRSALKGYRVSCTRLLGFDRQIVDNSGKEITRLSFRDKFRTSIDTRTILIPSAETETVKAIQWAFEHVKNGGSVNGAAAEFNRRGIKGVYGAVLQPSQLRSVLTNPAYCGTNVAGVQSVGKFRRISDTHKPIVIENAHKGLVDRETFETVSSIVKGNSIPREKWRTYLLSGIVVCGHCGRTLAPRTGATGEIHYACMAQGKVRGVRWDQQTPCPARPAFAGRQVENAVVRAWCDAFLQDDLEDQLKLPAAGERPAIEQEQLATVREQLSRAERNLALADTTDDFRAIKGVLADLRQREAALVTTISKTTRQRKEVPEEILSHVRELKQERERLMNWPNIERRLNSGTAQRLKLLTCKLATLLKQTVSSVILRMDIEDDCSRGNGKYGIRAIRRRTGIVSFNPEIISHPDVVLTDDMLSHPSRRKYRNVYQVLKNMGGNRTAFELANRMKKDPRAVYRALFSCEAEGKVRKLDAKPQKQALWTAVE